MNSHLNREVEQLTLRVESLTAEREACLAHIRFLATKLAEERRLAPVRGRRADVEKEPLLPSLQTVQRQQYWPACSSHGAGQVWHKIKSHTAVLRPPSDAGKACRAAQQWTNRSRCLRSCCSLGRQQQQRLLPSCQQVRAAARVGGCRLRLGRRGHAEPFWSSRSVARATASQAIECASNRCRGGRLGHGLAARQGVAAREEHGPAAGVADQPAGGAAAAWRSLSGCAV